MGEATLKEKTVALLRQGRQLERDTVAALSADQRDLIGTTEKWGVKDKLVHINAWKAATTEEFTDARAGKPRTDEREAFQTFNTRMFEQFREASWAEVEQYCDDVTNAMIAELEAYSDEELEQAGLYEWLEGRNVAEYAVSTAIWHGLMHMTEAYIERQDGEAALTMLSKFFPLTLEIIKGERGIGTAKYNQACIYAQLHGEAAALALLTEAFAARPDLKAFAPQDTDLQTLWEMDEFRTLVAA